MEYSTTEQLALNFLNNEYGAIREPMSRNRVDAYILQARTEYNYQSDRYYKRQSSINYNRMINAMIHLQYWNQKKVTE